MSSKDPIIFFDGVCNLCNSFVDLLIRIDKDHRFKFASLQGETAKNLLPVQDTNELKSVILLKEGSIYRESDAVLEIAKLLPFPWKLAILASPLPLFLRNSLYSWVASNRYRLFGKKDSCRLPTPKKNPSSTPKRLTVP